MWKLIFYAIMIMACLGFLLGCGMQHRDDRIDIDGELKLGRWQVYAKSVRVDGTNCIALLSGRGVALSCDWKGRP